MRILIFSWFFRAHKTLFITLGITVILPSFVVILINFCLPSEMNSKSFLDAFLSLKRDRANGDIGAFIYNPNVQIGKHIGLLLIFK